MELFRIGRISGTHHLKGTVKVTSQFEKVELIVGNKVMLELKSGQKKVLTVKECKRINNKIVLVDFEEVANKTDAMALIGLNIEVRRDILGEITEDEYYLQDLIGMKVYNNGEYLGEVEDVLETGAHDIYIVGEDELMIPAVDVFVLEVNFDEKKILTDLPEDLLNLNK